MALVDTIIRVGVAMLAMVAYIIGMSSAVWVKTDVDFEDKGKRWWGLWVICDNSSSCDYMSPGDSDTYYEVARTLSCITLVMHIVLYIGIQVKKCDMDQHLRGWLVFASLTEAMTVAVVSLVGGGYQTDSRWHNLDPFLGWGYWVVVIAAILLSVLCISFVVRLCQKKDRSEAGSERRCGKLFQKKEEPGRRNSAILTGPAVGPLPAGRKKQLEPLRTAEQSKAGPEQVISASQFSSSSSPWSRPAADPNVQSRPADSSLPLLTLPTYHLPPPPGQGGLVQAADPPSYHDVVNSGADQPPTVRYPDVV